MDLDRMHRAVRALVKGDEIPGDLSPTERRAVSTLRDQMTAILEGSPAGAAVRWVTDGVCWAMSAERTQA